MDRRNHPRFDVSNPVLYRPDTYPRPKVASTSNLSLGGMKLKIPYSLMAGEGLDVSIAVHPHVINCRGKVVYVSQLTERTMEAGIRFEEISPRDSRYLKLYFLQLMERRASELSKSFQSKTLH
ncbi:MAG: hypothetical protein GTN81_13470 [Proteobacteria bacterium]|nr:hypothetical protein [Pseudomonadota bacterium]